MPKNMPAVHPDAEIKQYQCGGCQWFSAGFQGKNCQKLREVVVDTPACVEYTLLLPDYLALAAKDKYILQIRESLKHQKYTTADILLDELKGYIVQLDSRPFDYGSRQDIVDIITALQKIVSYRSRVSIIYTTSIETKYEVEEMQRYIQLWLSSKYTVYRDLKNEMLRTAAVDRLVPELLPLQKNLSKVQSTAKYLDERLDSNDWTLRAILTTAEKLWYSRENFGNGGKDNRGGVRN